jgi:aryl-alcohol dehydrogenase-like predicted oxidoreductase
MNQIKGINRRMFLKKSAMGMIGGGVISQSEFLKSEEKIEAESPKIKEYRTLGRTGFKASDIGAGVTTDVGLLNALLDAGINYIDTAESYGKAESTIGEVIKNRDRKSLFISTRVGISTEIKKIPKEDLTKEGIVRRVHKSLEQLQTDYIDCLMIYSERVEILKSEDFHAAARQLKAEGRIRFVGVCHHGTQWWRRKPEETMEKVLLAAAEDGRFDVILIAYNFLKQDMSEKVLKVCKEKNIGTTLMKTDPTRQYYGLKQWIESQQKEGKEVDKRARDSLSKLKEKVNQAQGFMQKYNLQSPSEVRDAAIRFVLSNPDVNTVCISFRNFNDLRDYLNLSGTRLTPKDNKILTAYSRDCGSLYCRHACGLCESQCPNKVAVNTIMRYNHYFEAQGREKYAMAKYAGLPTPKADECQTCEGHCEAACPYDVPVRGLLINAHQNLTLV